MKRRVLKRQIASMLAGIIEKNYKFQHSLEFVSSQVLGLFWHIVAPRQTKDRHSIYREWPTEIGISSYNPHIFSTDLNEFSQWMKKYSRIFLGNL